MESFLGLIIGILITTIVFMYMKFIHSKSIAKSQSIILLDKIQKVCKFITVEGDFAEIYHYEDVKERFLKLISGRKKALVIINAKAYVGYDFSKVRLEANKKKRTIVLLDFPQPEVLNIESNLNYYDKKDGIFNRFEASDLTELHNEAKSHIMVKIPESGLFKIAQNEAVEAILLIENIVQTIGWKLDYSALQIEKDNSVKLQK